MFCGTCMDIKINVCTQSQPAHWSATLRCMLCTQKKQLYLDTWLGRYVLARNAASGNRSVLMRRSRHFSNLGKHKKVGTTQIK